MIGKVHLIPTFIATTKDFFALLTMNVMQYNFANVYKTRFLIEMETFPLVWTNRPSQCGHGMIDFSLQLNELM